jgi:hypothetical protein
LSEIKLANILDKKFRRRKTVKFYLKNSIKGRMNFLMVFKKKNIDKIIFKINKAHPFTLMFKI